MGKAIAWAVFIIFAAIVERMVAAMLPDDFLSRHADPSVEAEFVADVYVGVHMLPPSMLTLESVARERVHTLQNYNMSLRRNLFENRFYPYRNNFAAIRLTNNSSVVASNTSIRLPNFASGYIISSEDPAIFNRSNFIELGDLLPNHAVIVIAFADGFGPLMYYGEEDRLVIQSSQGRPQLNYVGHGVLGHPRSSQIRTFGENLNDWFDFILWIMFVGIIAIGPAAMAYFLEREKALLFIDDDYYAAERRHFLAEQGRNLLRKRAAEGFQPKKKKV